MANLPILDGVALVTGAASGIGKETAFTFAEAGCSAVVFADLNIEQAQIVAKESEKYAKNETYRASAVSVDVRDAGSVQSMVDVVMKEFQRIDYSVNCAGIDENGLIPSSDVSLDSFERTIDINLKGTVYCMQSVIKAMSTQEPRMSRSDHTRRYPPRSLGRGAIVNMGSVCSFVGRPGAISYNTAKHGVIGATKSAAQDHAPSGIRVNAVCPGATDTPMMQGEIERIPGLTSFLDAIPLYGRMGYADEIAQVIVFLCGPASNYITGASLIIDGGMTLTSAKS